jgi:hypothetical protein
MPVKRRRRSSSQSDDPPWSSTSEYGPQWDNWPAPSDAMERARLFILDVYVYTPLTGQALSPSVQSRRSILIVPDKDADGLSGEHSQTTRC